MRIGNVFEDRGEVAGNCYCKFPLRSVVKIDKRQSSLHYHWRVELLQINFGNQNEQFRWGHRSICRKNLIKNTAVLRGASNRLRTTFQPPAWNPPWGNPSHIRRLDMGLSVYLLDISRIFYVSKQTSAGSFKIAKWSEHLVKKTWKQEKAAFRNIIRSATARIAATTLPVFESLRFEETADAFNEVAEDIFEPC